MLPVAAAIDFDRSQAGPVRWEINFVDVTHLYREEEKHGQLHRLRGAHVAAKLGQYHFSEGSQCADMLLVCPVRHERPLKLGYDLLDL
jgi:hypothetical protein